MASPEHIATIFARLRAIDVSITIADLAMLGQTLKLTVIAKGVEQAEFLKAAGCVMAQDIFTPGWNPPLPTSRSGRTAA